MSSGQHRSTLVSCGPINILTLGSLKACQVAQSNVAMSLSTSPTGQPPRHPIGQQMPAPSPKNVEKNSIKLLKNHYNSIATPKICVGKLSTRYFHPYQICTEKTEKEWSKKKKLSISFNKIKAQRTSSLSLIPLLENTGSQRK